MYEAGSAAVILGYRVDKAGLESYLKGVERAKSQKGHEYLLTMKDEATGPMARFRDLMLGVDKSALQMQVTVDKAMTGIGGNITRTTREAASSMDLMDKSAKSVSDALLGMGTASRDMAKAVVDSNKAALDSLNRYSSTSLDYGRQQIRINTEQAASAREVAAAQEHAVRASAGAAERGYMNPVVAGGGDGGGGATDTQPGGGAGKSGGGAAGKGFDRMANAGKWLTFGLLGIGAVSVKWAADFQRAMQLIQTQVGYSERDVKSLSKSVLNLAPTVGVGPDKLAAGLYHVTSVLQGRGGTNAAMQILKTAAEGARVGMANMEDVSSALMAVYRSSPKDIHSVSEAMGVMNDIVGQGNLRMEDLSKALTTGVLAAAKNAHLGLRDLGAALDTMTSRGVPAEQASTRLRTTLTLMASPTHKAAQALAEVNMSSNQLAIDMQQHGLVYALQDLQKHLNETFPPGKGHTLSIEEQRVELMKYGHQLEAAGVSGASLAKDLKTFKDQLDQSGTSAVKQSQLITSAFGGSRMGTTMALLLQNVGDVHSRFDALNKANAAGRFQRDWQATQKDFSQRMAEMWAGVQKLGIELGDQLIPKISDLINWLIKAYHWLENHQTILKALEVLFGTILVAAIVAFFARLAKGIAGGVRDIALFTKAIAEAPSRSGKYLIEMGTQFTELRDKILGVGAAVKETNAQSMEATVVTQGAPGEAGAAGGALGVIEGMINGIAGTMAPGSRENPLAVFVVDPSGGGGMPLGKGGASTVAAEEKILQQDAAAMSGGGVAAAGERAAVTAGGGAAAAGSASRLARLGARVSGGVGTALKGAGELAGPVMWIGIGGLALAQSGAGNPQAFKFGEHAVGQTNFQHVRSGGYTTGGVMSRLGGFSASSGGGTGPSDAQISQVQKLMDTVQKIKHPADLSAQALKGFMDRATQLSHEVPQAAGPLDKLWRELEKVYKPKEDWNRGFNEAWKAINRFVVRGGDSIKNLRDRFDTNMRLIASTVGLNSAAGEKLANTNFSKFVGDIDQAMSKGKISATSGIKAITFAATHGTSQMRDELAQTYQSTVQVIQSSWQAGKISTSDALSAIRNLTNNENQHIRGDIQNHYRNLLNDAATMHASGLLTDQQYSDRRKALYQDMAQAIQNKELTLGKNSTAILDGMNKATAGGMNDLFKELNRALSQLKVTQVHWTTKSGEHMNSSANWQHGFRLASLHASGGVLPGAEFGLQDNMTLVDPRGKPVARMAGDEAVFNRHQMPYVEAGLQMLGFKGAQDLWKTVNKPHGFEKGGKLPGFASGGALPYSQIEGVWDRAGGPRGVASVAAAIAMAESSGIPSNVQQGQPYSTTGWGLWQITPGNSEPQFGVNGALLNPLNNAKAAVAKYRGASNTFGPWTTFMSGAYRQFMHGNVPANMNAAGAMMMASLIPPHLMPEGLPYGHLGQGALNHATRAANQYLANINPSGIGNLQMGTHGVGGAAPIKAGLPASVISMIREADLIASHDFPYVWGGGHGRLGVPSTGIPGPGFNGRTRGFDCSGTVSAVLGAAGLVTSPMVAQAYMNWGDPGPGKYVSIFASPSHVFMEIDRHYFGTSGGNPGGGANWIRGFPEAMPAVRHPKGLQLGGFINGGNFMPGPDNNPEALDFFKKLPGQEQRRLHHNHRAILPGLAGGGYLPHFATGGSRRRRHTPWGSLPSDITSMPGYRPIRVRRGTGGLHTVGGGRGRGSRLTGGGSRSSRSGRAGNVKGKARTRQTLSQTTANVLKSMGLGSFASDQNELGKLDQEYSTQESLFSMFDEASGAGLPVQDLNTLMSIREDEWDILYKEWQQLPVAIDAVKTRVTELTGSAGHPAQAAYYTYKDHRGHTHRVSAAQAKHKHMDTSSMKYHARQAAIPRTLGVNGLDKDITETESQIRTLQHDATLDTRAAAVVRHNITARAMSLADGYAQEVAGYYDLLSNIADQRYNLSQQRLALRKQSEAVSSVSAGPSLSSLVGDVLSGVTAPTTTSGAATQRKAIQRQITELTAKDEALTHGAAQVRQRVAALDRKKQAAARHLRAEGFNEAWHLTLAKWKVQDRVWSLQNKLKRLKLLLKAETEQLKQDSAALQTLQNWQTGGLQGTESIINSLGDIGMDMLGLYQTGAGLPTPGRKEPTVNMVKAILSGKPPKGLGLTLPAGLIQGVQTATQAYTDFTNFQAQRQNLFAQFGSNFVPAGASPFGSSAAVGAGVQYYGAAAGASAGPGTPPATGGFAGGGWLHAGPGMSFPWPASPTYPHHPPRGQGGWPGPGRGDFKITVENHFAQGPPDPHTWSAGTAHELQAQM